jgi:uncharacterized protein
VSMTLAQVMLGFGSGGLVGFSLGLVGGGGSILAIPLLVYVVGVASPHVAIGVSAVAVAVNALASFIGHVRAGHVKWNCAITFALAGAGGAFLGSTLGKMADGETLLALFGVLMVVIGGLMLRRRGGEGNADVKLDWGSARRLLPRLVGFGGGAGMMAGFFGIGGGFLIVPGLIYATGMPMVYAVGSSLLAVTAFGASTAANYALSGLVDWTLAGVFIAGGLVGGVLGVMASRRLAAVKGALDVVFATVIISVGSYMLLRSMHIIS